MDQCNETLHLDPKDATAFVDHDNNLGDHKDMQDDCHENGDNDILKEWKTEWYIAIKTHTYIMPTDIHLKFVYKDLNLAYLC